MQKEGAGQGGEAGIKLHGSNFLAAASPQWRDAEVGIRGVNALQLDCVQHILGRQVRPLEEKRTAVPAGKLKKSPGFCAVPEEVRVIKKAGRIG